jgi:hypothetical protein
MASSVSLGAQAVVFASCSLAACAGFHRTERELEEREALDVIGEFFETEREAQEPYCRCFDCDPSEVAEHIVACYEAAARLYPQDVIEYFGAWVAYRRELTACYRAASCLEISGHDCVVEPAAILREPPAPWLANAITECATATAGQVLEVMRESFDLLVESHMYYCECVECGTRPPSEPGEAERSCRDAVALRHPDEFLEYFGAWVSFRTERVECYRVSTCEEIASGACLGEAPVVLLNPPPPAVWLMLAECTGL